MKSSYAALTVSSPLPPPPPKAAASSSTNPLPQTPIGLPSVISNPDSPYYLHPSETPTLTLVSTPFSGLNYRSWARAMKMALLVKNKWEFVSGSIKVPKKDDELYPQWRRCNAMVASWILRSVTATIANSVLSLDVASEIWEDLKERFCESDAFRISDLLEQIYSLKQGSSTVTEYYNQFKTLWNELLFLRPLPICECYPSCQCDAVAKAKEHLQNDQVLRFLKGLNDNFATLRLHIMLMEPLPEVNKAFAMIIQQERQYSNTQVTGNSGFISQVSSDDAYAHYGSAYPNSSYINFGEGTACTTGFSGNNNKKVQCTFCGLQGHTIEKCYRKHGFPPGYKPKSGQGNTNGNRVAN